MAFSLGDVQMLRFEERLATGRFDLCARPPFFVNRGDKVKVTLREVTRVCKAFHFNEFIRFEQRLKAAVIAEWVTEQKNRSRETSNVVLPPYGWEVGDLDVGSVSSAHWSGFLFDGDLHILDHLYPLELLPIDV